MSENNEDHRAFATLGLVAGMWGEKDVIRAYRKLALRYYSDPDGLEKINALNDAKERILTRKLCSQQPSQGEPEAASKGSTTLSGPIRFSPEVTGPNVQSSQAWTMRGKNAPGTRKDIAPRPNGYWVRTQRDRRAVDAELGDYPYLLRDGHNPYPCRRRPA